MDKILFVDAHNQIYRACVKFGQKDQTAKDEIIFTFNFFRNFRALLQDFEPDKCYLVFEGRPQFRYDLYPEYKANRLIKQGSRAQMVENFEKTKEIVYPLLKHLPLTLVRATKYEADDVIATLVDNMKNEDISIISGDTDFIQLLQKDYSNIRIYDSVKKKDMEAPNEPYIALKSLKGDKGDNIKRLMSDKKAINLLNNPLDFKKFLSIEENRANFNINKQLIELAKVPLEEIETTEGHTNFPLLKQKFTEMEFNSLINDQAWDRFQNTFNCIKF